MHVSLYEFLKEFLKKDFLEESVEKVLGKSLKKSLEDFRWEQMMENLGGFFLELY